MSTKDSSKTGNKSQTQIEIERKLEQDLVFGKNTNLGNSKTPPEEGGDIPWTMEGRMKRFKILEIHHPEEPEKLNGSKIPPYSPYRSEGMKRSIEAMIGEPLTDKWKWTFQGEPMLTKEQMDKDHKEAINIRDFASMHRPGEKGIKDQEGVKKSNHKPQVGLLDIQFPKALRAISQASMAGHEKYKETDQDYKNFKRVPDAENQYRHASRRHELDREDSYLDEDTQMPHIVLKAWNVLAELELHLENKVKEKIK